MIKSNRCHLGPIPEVRFAILSFLRTYYLSRKFGGYSVSRFRGFLGYLVDNNINYQVGNQAMRRRRRDMSRRDRDMLTLFIKNSIPNCPSSFSPETLRGFINQSLGVYPSKRNEVYEQEFVEFCSTQSFNPLPVINPIQIVDYLNGYRLNDMDIMLGNDLRELLKIAEIQDEDITSRYTTAKNTLLSQDTLDRYKNVTRRDVDGGKCYSRGVPHRFRSWLESYITFRV